jgi:hypothetical protein
VSFYILTFKKKLLISFLLIFSIFFVLDLSLYLLVKAKTTKTSFIDDKFSKIDHFKFRDSKDIIFLGSSTTFYGISTNVFNKEGVDIYNFGISGIQFVDYPALVPYINNKNPKKVIISLSVTKLYSELGMSKYPTFDEIKYYYEIDKIKFLYSIKEWIVNRHLFLRYSEPIFFRLKNIYDSFNFLLYNQSIRSIIKHNNISIDNSINYSNIVNCEVFDVKKIKNKKLTLKCKNGDGVLIGSSVENKMKNQTLPLNLNKQSVQYIQKLIDSLTTQDTKVIIILEPTRDGHFLYDLKDIKHEFKPASIIDLTNFKIKDKLWADKGHLNYKGRNAYSEHLLGILKDNFD